VRVGLRHAAQRLVLDLDPLRHGLLDELGIRDGRLDALRGGDALRDHRGGARREEPLLLELLGLGADAIEIGRGDLGGDVGDDDIVAGQCEHLRHPATHVATADDGDPGHERASLF